MCVVRYRLRAIDRAFVRTRVWLACACVFLHAYVCVYRRIHGEKLTREINCFEKTQCYPIHLLYKSILELIMAKFLKMPIKGYLFCPSILAL